MKRQGRVLPAYLRPYADTHGNIIVEIANVYECGRHSGSAHVLTAPTLDTDDQLQVWFDAEVEPLTGDGHPCGSREHAYYEATIIAAPGRDWLVGETYSWGG